MKSLAPPENVNYNTHVLATTQNRPRTPPVHPPAPGAAHLRLHRAIEALILALLAGLLARRPRFAGAWHPIPDPTPIGPATPVLRLPTDGTHLVCEHPILWVIGPGPNRGLRPRPRAHPIPRPRTARAPPATPRPPIRRGTLQTGGVDARPYSFCFSYEIICLRPTEAAQCCNLMPGGISPQTMGGGTVP